MIFVNGTDHESLKKGPGRDLRTFMPGQGQLVYIAGHRTTYLAPFSHIDSLRAGDRVTLEVPYATFVYRIVRHRIVPSDDLSVLKSHRHEVVILQACPKEPGALKPATDSPGRSVSPPTRAR